MLGECHFSKINTVSINDERSITQEGQKNQTNFLFLKSVLLIEPILTGSVSIYGRFFTKFPCFVPIQEQLLCLIGCY